MISRVGASAAPIAELGAMAPGRFTFGVGVGGEDRHEVEICGVDPATRGRRMDECMEIVRGLLSGDELSFDGEFFQLDEARIVPSPSPAVPIVVGGRSDAAVRRVGRLGDGWFGIWVSPRRYAQVVSTVEQHAVEAGRGDVEWSHALNVWCGVGRDADDARRHVAPAMEGFYQLPFDRFAKWSPVGTAGDVADFLAPYVEAGCTTFNLILHSASPEAALDAAAEIRQRLIGSG
jgi:alkanesulfonate monooxygenase SsuD/methylene tetrahydromethanopterin reductase-like flavin-dependent oxidoreductase (luciferase family)